MSFIINVKNSQSEFQITAHRFQNTYYVDDSIKDGLELGTFCGIASGNSKCRQENGTAQAVMVPAGKDIKVKAAGIVYDSSSIDQYRRTDDLSNETRLYPYGDRQDMAFGLLKKGVIEISNTANKHNIRVYRTVDQAFGKGTVASGVLTLTKGTKELKYGDKITFGDDIGHISEVTNETTYKVVGIGDASDKEVVAKCQMDEPVYLNKAVVIKPEAKGHFEKMEELPFTTVPPVQGELSQVVGYIESPKHIRIDLTIQVDPIVL